MSDAFLQRSRAKLAIAKLLGFLDRKIRRSLRESSEGDLWMLGIALHKRARELALAESPPTCKIPSMGARYRAWNSHPFKKYLDNEESIRFDERVAADPEYFKTPFDDLSHEELDNYRQWYLSTPPDRTWHMTVDEKYATWRRESRRILPVMPKSGSLPTNSNVGRTYNNRERSGSSRASPKARPGKIPKTADEEAEGQIFRSLEDREIH